MGHPYIHRDIWINQMGSNTIPQVFKMFIIDPKFGVHILDQMQEGRNLEGVWIYFDMVDCILSGWKILGVHIYNWVE